LVHIALHSEHLKLSLSSRDDLAIEPCELLDLIVTGLFLHNKPRRVTLVLLSPAIAVTLFRHPLVLVEDALRSCLMQ
jgi:hypothetical protein